MAQLEEDVGATRSASTRPGSRIRTPAVQKSSKVVVPKKAMLGLSDSDNDLDGDEEGSGAGPSGGDGDYSIATFLARVPVHISKYFFNRRFCRWKK